MSGFSPEEVRAALEAYLAMVHVTEEIRESGWRPGPGFAAPPAKPRR